MIRTYHIFDPAVCVEIQLYAQRNSSMCPVLWWSLNFLQKTHQNSCSDATSSAFA